MVKYISLKVNKRQNLESMLHVVGPCRSVGAVELCAPPRGWKLRSSRQLSPTLHLERH